jgi:Leucine-rich repeat (LRR) protein
MKITHPENLVGLESYNNLRYLDLSKTEYVNEIISDIAPVFKLTNLTELNLSCHQSIQSLKGLANLVNLRTLHLDDMRYLLDSSDVKYLNLTVLSIWKSNIDYFKFHPQIQRIIDLSSRSGQHS